MGLIPSNFRWCSCMYPQEHPCLIASSVPEAKIVGHHDNHNDNLGGAA